LQQVLLKKLAGKTAPQEQEVLGLMEQPSVVSRGQSMRLPRCKSAEGATTIRGVILPGNAGEVRYDLSALLESSQGQILAQLQVDQVRFPRQYLRSIVYNLLSNALKYRSPHRDPLVKVVTNRKGTG
jgi:signal transduction histidine kinase